MMTMTELSDQYFHWWQSAATRYLEMFKQEPFLLRGWGFSLERSLEFKKMVSQVMDEIWRNFRLPPLEEIIRLQERVNHLESRLVALQERDWAQEVANTILKKRDIAAREDLKPLKKALTDMEKQMAGASELDRLKATMAQVEAKIGSLAEELVRIKETLTQVDLKLGSLPAASEKLARVAPAREPDTAGKS